MKNSQRLYGILIGGLLAATGAYAAPTISISNTSAAPGTTVDITVNLTADSANPVAGLQYDIPLPTGFTLISGSTGTATLAAGKPVNVSLVSGSIRTLIYEINSTNIGTGSVAIYRVSLASNLTPGSRSLSFTNMVASSLPGNAVSATLTPGSVNILDIAAPTVPTNLTAVAVSSTRVNVAWTASTDNLAVTGYRIVRNGVFLASSTVTSFSNSGLNPSTNYSYTVQAFDAAGNLSAATTAVSALTLTAPDTAAPTVPSNVAAVAVSSTRINVSWTASTDNMGVTGYQLLRNGVQISSVTSGTSYVNSGLTPLTLYSYTLRAFDAAGNLSAASSPASATTLGDRCDLNIDASVNAVDLAIVANSILTNTMPMTYDLNRDTRVDVIDIQILINVILLTGTCPQ